LNLGEELLEKVEEFKRKSKESGNTADVGSIDLQAAASVGNSSISD